MPVKRVNFSIDETAVAEGATGRERLTMEVVTDGSTSPDDAIAEAANQLIELFQPLATFLHHSSSQTQLCGTPTRKVALLRKQKIPSPVGTSVHHPRAPLVSRGAPRARAPLTGAQFHRLWGMLLRLKVTENHTFCIPFGTPFGTRGGRSYNVLLIL